MKSFDWSRSLDPAYLFGYGLYYFFDRGYQVRKVKADWGNSRFNQVKDLYHDTSVDTYEWRANHSEDPVLGYWWKKANERDYNAEKKKYQEDLKKNTGYNWKDNAYPLTAYHTAFGYSGGKSAAFEVNDAIMSLYNGVKKW